MIAITKALFEIIQQTLYGQIAPPAVKGVQTVQQNAPNVTTAAKGLVKPYSNTGALKAPAGVPAAQAPVQVARAAPMVTQPPPAPVIAQPQVQTIPVQQVTAAGNTVAVGPEAVKSDLIAQNANTKAVQQNISGAQATGELLKRGAKSAGEAVGDIGKKVSEFAQDNPLAAGIGAGAVGALGIRRLINRNKPA